MLVGAFLLSPEMRREIVKVPYGPYVFWSLVALFGAAWPWLLTAFHRGFAERALQRVLRDALVNPLSST